MKKVCSYLVLLFICCLALGCGQIGADAQSATTPQAKATPQPAFECVRSKPDAIIDLSKFPDTTFRLEKNKEFPYQDIGYENVRFDNSDELEIENTGCENYTLIFKFRTKRFDGKPDDSKFWYKKALQLLNGVKPGIREEDSQRLTQGIASLKKYSASQKSPKYGELLEFGKGEISQSITLESVTLLDSGMYEIQVSLGVGPL